MTRVNQLLLCFGSIACVCTLSFTLNGTFQAEAPEVFAAEGGASISDVMVVAHAGKTSLLNQLKAAVRGSGPSTDKEWKAVRASGGVLASLASDVLGKRKPKKGSEASWKEQVGLYASAANKLASAAAQQDLDATSSAVKTLSRSCSGCHKPHK